MNHLWEKWILIQIICVLWFKWRSPAKKGSSRRIMFQPIQVRVIGPGQCVSVGRVLSCKLKVTGSIPDQGTCLGRRFDPQHDRCFFLTSIFSFSLPSLLSRINKRKKYFLKERISWGGQQLCLESGELREEMVKTKQGEEGRKSWDYIYTAQENLKNW